MKSLIYIDNQNYKNSIDLLEVVRQVYPSVNCETYGVSINKTGHEELKAFDQLIEVVDEEIVQLDPYVITNVLEELHNKYDFDLILIPATSFGRMLAPRLAMRLHVGLVADVTGIDYDKEQLEMIRPAFSGKIMAAIVKRGDGPIMMSVRQNVFSYKGDPVHTQVISYKPVTKKRSKLKLISSDVKVQSYDISESDVLISGGGGTIKNFDKLQSLADVLDGQVSASRKIIDKGLATRVIQVGQSGKTVNPKLYIALGVSGAIQHIEGLKNVEHIISVNTNKNAPICSLSDIVVEGDASKFIDKLTARIKKG